MSTTSTRLLQFSYSGDITVPQQIWADALNTTSPGPGQLYNLVMGDNAFLVPTGSTPLAVSILKPPLGVVVLKLKYVGGDSGVLLGQGFDSISLASSATGIIINASAALAGVRIAWH